MNPAKLIELQQQVRINQAEMQESFKDLDSWISEIKEKEDNLKKQADPESEKLPPVRNSLQKKKKKKKPKHNEENGDVSKKPRRIRSYDFKAWDKFDVDKACKEVDENESEESEYETDEEWEELRKKQQAVLLKDQGNQYFKEGKISEAIECYTEGLRCDPDNFLLPANRAMAYLKQEKYEEAEADCTAAIALDPTYVKSYQRRAKARTALKKYKEAESDLRRVLSFDPKNKLAKSELDKLNKLTNPPQFSVSTEGDVGIVKAIYKPPEQRSKKPLHRLIIEEVGVECAKKTLEAPSSQSETKKKIESKDYQEFEKFVKNAKNCADAEMKSSTSEIIPGNTNDENRLNSPADINTGTVKHEDDATHAPVTQDVHISVPKRREERRCSDVTNQTRQIPPTPSSSYHFQADWKILKDTSKHFYDYFKQIEPASYPKLIGQFLDAAILMKILCTLRDFYITDNIDFIQVLEYLTRVQRFGMVVMFLSADDKKVIKDLLAHVKGKCDPDVLKKLKKLYEVQ